MARGFGYGKAIFGKDTRKKLFWAGLVEGINWTHQGGGSYSIGERINLSTSSDYYVTGQYISPLLDLTNYTKLHFTIISSGGQRGDCYTVGISPNTTIQSFTSQKSATMNADLVIDISGYTGSYYVKLFTSSANRYGSNLSVSHIWLE